MAIQCCGGVRGAERHSRRRCNRPAQHPKSEHELAVMGKGKQPRILRVTNQGGKGGGKTVMEEAEEPGAGDPICPSCHWSCKCCAAMAAEQP